MSKTLAISWNTTLVRFVLSESTKSGALRVLQSGERLLATPENNVDDDLTTDDSRKNEAAVDSRDTESELVNVVQNVVREEKAGRARLVICLNRGMVDSASFNVPPADAAELPVIVRNMAGRHLSGVSEDSVVDFIPETSADEQVTRVCAMTLPRPEQSLVERIASESGCASARAIVVTHALRLFAPQGGDKSNSVSLIVSKGRQSGQLLLVRNGMPVNSRSLRLAVGMKGDGEAAHLAAEVQRTLLATEAQEGEELDINDAVVIGAEIESAALQHELSTQLGIEVGRASATSVVEGEVGEASVSAYAPLIAACAEDAFKTPPVVDFLNPRKPPKSASSFHKSLVIAAAVALLVGGGWYYVNSMFAEARTENVRLRERGKELDELVSDTRSKRNLAKVLTAWENGRMSWLDELRDLTVRTPSSPDLTIDQFSAAVSGRDFVVSFRGTSKHPDVIRAMEEQLRDKYHAPKTPGIREVRNGSQSIWSFQTTMRVKNRPKDSYVSHLVKDAAEKATRAIPTKSKTTTPDIKGAP